MSLYFKFTGEAQRDGETRSFQGWCGVPFSWLRSTRNGQRDSRQAMKRLVERYLAKWEIRCLTVQEESYVRPLLLRITDEPVRVFWVDGWSEHR